MQPQLSDLRYSGMLVSILTRPGGRVQRGFAKTWYDQSGFQSSPDPEAGCNIAQQRDFAAHGLVSILTRPGGRVQPTSTGAHGSSGWFQSSPDPEAGCNNCFGCGT